MSGPVLEVKDLHKRYGDLAAVDGVSFVVQPGEVFGILGPNGAGKTTTIRLLMDLIRPDCGSATILGLDSRRDSRAIKRRVGYLPGEPKWGVFAASEAQSGPLDWTLTDKASGQSAASKRTMPV